jgi:hypothetical protein
MTEHAMATAGGVAWIGDRTGASCAQSFNTR